ncbi:MAG: 1-deoxy-D-xylulose-5-phosphate reductoisomerase [Bacteroidaceae bacterium]|nr:1-deoxy-D-xylulose-5-phosphate reductoisomerase [Bacteroidaceae bacterium]
MTKKRIAILGSTGSIGMQALDVIAEHPDLYRVEVLTAGRQVEKLIEQARRFFPDAVVIADESRYEDLRTALEDLPIKTYCGADALCQVVEGENVDVVLTALVGFAGMLPTIHAIRARKMIALANKETLVAGGDLITRLAAEYGAPILPVDSEHSAIFQSLVGEDHNEIDKILLTASGGPFRTLPKEALHKATAAEALKHPNWAMGAKITIDSATMMNKGLEVIEARWLFGVRPDQIQVVVHPQSVIHSAVQFADGAVKAQLGVPDMRLPIQYALSFPDRLPLSGPRLDLFALGQLTFEEPDMDKFPCLQLAYEALERGGNVACVMNTANEVMNQAFRDGKISFDAIYTNIRRVMDTVPYDATPSFDTYIATDRETRRVAEQMIS